MAYISTAEAAASIRTQLKAAGIAPKQVSVRSNSFSGGSSITVCIKDPAVPMKRVREVALQFEKFDRCKITHEILAGCNRYVDVEYSREAKDALAEELLPTIQRAMETHPGGNSLVPVEGTEFLLGRPDNWRWTVWARTGAGGTFGHVSQASDAREVAGVMIWQRGK